MPDNNATLSGSDARHQSRKHGGRSTTVVVTLVAAVVVLVALLIFVAQNSQSVRIRYLGADTSVGFGIALLVAAVAGALIAALVGSVLKIRRSLKSGS